MHELSLAGSIVDIVEEYVPAGQRRAVKSVRLKVGVQAGVVIDSLEFCFSAITTHTSLEGARLEVERVPFSLTCRSCNSTISDSNGILRCPSCGGNEVSIISGTELQVTEIELHDQVSEVS